MYIFTDEYDMLLLKINGTQIVIVRKQEERVRQREVDCCCLLPNLISKEQSY